MSAIPKRTRKPRAPRALFVLSSGPGWLYQPDDVFESRKAAKYEQKIAREVYNERLTLHTYKLQPVRR
jgi:hypothetical protein